jgi:hydroxyacylglutathione hydrolase
MISVLSVGPIGENVHIVENQAMPVVVIDPGAEPGRVLTETMAALGRSGAASVHIALTHGHLDHVAGLPGLLAGLRAAGIPVKVFAPDGDRSYFGAQAYETNERVFADIHAISFLKKFWTPIPDADVYFGNGFILPDTDIRVIHTPGHTPGSSCFLAEGDTQLISGDTLFFDGRGRTDAFDGDDAALLRSIDERLLIMDDAVRVWPGHGRQTTLGRERHNYR